MLIFRNRTVRIVRLQLLIHLALELCQCIHTCAANTNTQCCTAKLFRFLRRAYYAATIV